MFIEIIRLPSQVKLSEPFYYFTFRGGGLDSSIPEAEFVDVIGEKVLRVSLLAIHIHLY